MTGSTTVDERPRRPIVKVCGITRPEDAEASVRLGADLLGVNLWPSSPRFVTRDRIAAIRARVGAAVPLVGVVVDRGPEEVERLLDDGELDLVQLHGHEPAEAFGQGRERLVRSVVPGPETAAFVTSWSGVAAWLVESPRAPAFGGSGIAWAWQVPAALFGTVFVAGGLRPENVRQALEGIGAPPGVSLGLDVCSGVEATPGIKDHEKLERFFHEVRRHGQHPA